MQHRGRPHPTHSLHGARGAMGTHRARRSSSSSSSKTPTPRRDIPADFNGAEDRCLSLLVRSRPLPSPRKPAGTSPGQRTDQVEEASGRLDHARWRQAGWPDGVPAVALRRGCVRVRDRLVGLARGWWWWSLFLSSRAGRSVHTRSVFFEVSGGRAEPACFSSLRLPLCVSALVLVWCWGSAEPLVAPDTRGEGPSSVRTQKNLNLRYPSSSFSFSSVLWGRVHPPSPYLAGVDGCFHSLDGGAQREGDVGMSDARERRATDRQADRQTPAANLRQRGRPSLSA